MKPPKVLVLGTQWFGDLLKFCERGFTELNVDVKTIPTNLADPPIKDWASVTRWMKELPLLGRAIEQRHYQMTIRKHVLGLEKKIIDTIKTWKPDVLLSVLSWGDSLSLEVLNQIKATTSVIRIGWLMDDPFWHTGSLTALLNGFDRLYVVDGSWIEPIRLISGVQVSTLPCGADLFSSHPIERECVPRKYDCGITFVGSSYQGNVAGVLRKKLLASISHLDLHIYGDSNWMNKSKDHPDLSPLYFGGELNSEEVNLAYNGATIALNIHHPQFRSGTSLRTFAICASGAMQLVDWRPELDQYFELDKEIVTYKDQYELREKAEYYLKNPAERKHIAKAGLERVRCEHTYTHRLKQILSDASIVLT